MSRSLKKIFFIKSVMTVNKDLVKNDQQVQVQIKSEFELI